MLCEIYLDIDFNALISSLLSNKILLRKNFRLMVSIMIDEERTSIDEERTSLSQFFYRFSMIRKNKIKFKFE